MKKKSSPPRLPVRKGGYANLISDLTELLEEARRAAARSVNTVLTATYWEVGRRIVEFEQGGANRAAYGETLLRRLSQDLSVRFGRGFSRENLRLMRLFCLHYRERISQTVSRKLPAVPLHVKSQTPSGLSPIHAAGSERTWIFETLPMCFPLPWSHYALGDLSNKVFASRYKLQLPDPDLLKREIESERRRLEARGRQKG